MGLSQLKIQAHIEGGCKGGEEQGGRREEGDRRADFTVYQSVVGERREDCGAGQLSCSWVSMGRHIAVVFVCGEEVNFC